MDQDRRTFVAAAAAALAAPALAQRTSDANILRPEDFGALGNGTANDSDAFAALSAEVNRRGGGTIALRRGATYIVGKQTRGGAYAWTPAAVIELDGLTMPLRIEGNGARLRCQPGLRFGTFDPSSDRPVRRPMPNLKADELASPYRGMIYIRHSRAPISIANVELDGSLEHLRIGGQFGDTGWQVPATGLLLEGNLASELIDNIYTHHHGQDGAMIIGDDRRSARSRFTRLLARFNGRQGLSLTGGRGYDFEDCEFTDTGRSAISSAPAAGVDIEAEVGTVRDLSFTRCKFADNNGAGLLAEAGDGANARFSECLLVGSTTWSAWPNKPGFLFERCTFAGSVVNPFPSKDPAVAAKFVRCLFTDNPSHSGQGKLFFGQGPIVNMGVSDNVLFAGCRFELADRGVLPWSWRAIYQDCTMRQASKETGQTKGRYLGRSIIDGPVDLYGSMIEGIVILNGKTVPRGPVGSDFEPW